MYDAFKCTQNFKLFEIQFKKNKLCLQELVINHL